jgi:hypothetical protein
MIGKIAKLAAAAVLGLTGVGIAQAGPAYIYEIHEGVIAAYPTYNIDNDGLFGAVGANLTGAHYTLTFTQILNEVTTDGAGVWPGYYSTQSYYGPGTASITINGHTFSYTGSDTAISRTAMEPGAPPSWGVTEIGAQSYDGIYFFQAGVTSAESIFASVDPRTPFSYVLTDADRAYGGTFGAFAYGGGGDFATQFILSDNEVRGGMAPEPASWAMMVGGFGLVGGALGRRRRIRFA